MIESTNRIQSHSKHYFESGLNPLSTNPTKWSNTLKQFVGSLPKNCLSVSDQFVKLTLNGLYFFRKTNEVSALNSVSTARKCIKKETPTQVFSCKFQEIFQNIFCTEYLRTTASALPQSRLAQLQKRLSGGVLQYSFS